MPKKKKDPVEHASLYGTPLTPELATPDIIPGKSLTQEKPQWATGDASARRDKMAQRIADKMGLTVQELRAYHKDWHVLQGLSLSSL